MSHHCKDPRVLNVAQLVQALDWMASSHQTSRFFLLHMSVNEVVFFFKVHKNCSNFRPERKKHLMKKLKKLKKNNSIHPSFLFFKESLLTFSRKDHIDSIDFHQWNGINTKVSASWWPSEKALPLRCSLKYTNLMGKNMKDMVIFWGMLCVLN